MWGGVRDEDWKESWVALIMTDTEEREKSSSVLVVSVKWILSNTGTLFCNNVIIYIHKIQETKDG